MNNFEAMGQAMLMAEQGKQEMARAAAIWLADRFAVVAKWLRGAEQTEGTLRRS